MSDRKRVAVIGAGASGLTAIKSCLDEGMTPICFERTGDIGGLWNFSQNVIDGKASVMKSTTINTSKEMMSFSDFPPPKEFPTNMHNSKVLEYFRLYADNFRLADRIKFNTSVLEVKPSSNFSETGEWLVTTRDNQTQKELTENFHGVLVCTGHHADKHMPTFPGEESFKGRILHSHDYRDFHGFEDKRVVVVGLGNSGGDLAVELSRICSQVYLSTRRGGWLLSRTGDHGMPVDLQITTRFGMLAMGLLPWGMMNSIVEKQANKKLDHNLYCLRPEHRVMSCHPLVNDDLPNRIISGNIVIKSNIKRITESGVQFDDGTSVDDIDAIVYATGYVFGFPFIKHPGYEVKSNKVNLYKYMYAPDVQPRTLAVIGVVQPWGSTIPIAEIQNRLACRVIKGDCQLPSADAMWEDIREKQRVMNARYVSSQRHTIQVDVIPFMDEIADLIGCKPNLRELWWRNPQLAWTVLFGPCAPYQYRLQGPGAWTGAADALRTIWQRTVFPLKTRPLPPSPKEPNWPMVIMVILLACFVWWLL